MSFLEGIADPILFGALVAFSTSRIDRRMPWQLNVAYTLFALTAIVRILQIAFASYE